MSTFKPLRQMPEPARFGSQDSLVVFGELFQRGYANGIVDEARSKGMKVFFSTVGRRDEGGNLRELNAEELAQAEKPLINVALEAGFDMEKAANGERPIDQLKDLGLKDWQTAKLQWPAIQDARLIAVESFRTRVKQWVSELENALPASGNIVFAHTMAGGVPRAKVIMPAMNRVFKGSGDRFASSEEFWSSDLGRLCNDNFMEVTAETFHHLIDLTSSLRQVCEKRGGKVSYVAYGYHGTEVLCEDRYHWQSYSPYLQGFAKIKLEEIAERHWKNGVKATVFNAPEILTNSSSIFLGVEVPLYNLLGALKKEGGTKAQVKACIETCMAKLKSDVRLEQILDFTARYFKSDVIQRWTQFPKWPQHNGPEQMAVMREASNHLLSLHKSEKDLATAELSEVVFRACGDIMLRHSFAPSAPVWWLGHDIIAKQAAL